MPLRKSHHELFRLSALITGFLSDSLSEEEKRELQTWISEQESHRILFEKICAEDTMQSKLHRYSSEDIYSAFLKFTKRRRQRTLQRRIYRWSACAAVALFLGGAWWQWQSGMSGAEDRLLLSQSMPAEDAPARRPVLVLATGERLIVPEGRLAFEETPEGQRVMAGDELLATDESRTEGDETACHTIEVPPKCDFHFVMSDGTKVWMNAASSLRYPVKFAADSRTVHVTGEVYLEVAKDAHRPFYVEVDGMRIAVLGTCFNVRAYPHEQVVRVTLAEGKVEAQIAGNNYALEPGCQLSRSEESGKVDVRAVDVEDVLAWRRGFYVFKKTRLAEVASTLQCWYNMNIVMTSQVSATTVYTGVVNKEEPIEVFLRRLEEVSSVKYIRQEDIVLIY